ncbi:hypothetical protein Tsubulata_032397 [Turnera subulata]|uniref:2-carboxy-D-arabinitol-1-phosphatase n=1 Tax=Turnera subulata TaxID=218843 RepID=A0A9Q0F4D4_9ROSI|nr:hypothetical protein Tsubulata_032397 [Turnera subulata]
MDNNKMRLETCWFCSATIYPGHGIQFVRNDCKIFRFCRSKCHKNFKMKRNPRKVKWTKAYRLMHGKDLAEDSTSLSFEKHSTSALERKRNRPERYDRNLTEKVLPAIKKIVKIRHDRAAKHIEKRHKGKKAQKQKEDRKEVEQNFSLIRAPGVLQSTPKVQVKTLSIAVAPPSLFLHSHRRNHRLHSSHHRRSYLSTTTIRASSSSIQELDQKSLQEKNLSPELYSTAPFPPIKAAKRVVLVRHGQSTWNAEGRIQGSSDFSVLTKKGEAQAETSRQMLLDDSFDVCFSSPLARSKKTAEIIWGPREEEMITDSDLREIDLYSFQGLLKHEGKEKFGAAFRQWQVDAPNFNIDGHYPVRELWARARNSWNKILDHESRSVLVVAHNAVNQALVATAMGLGTEYFRVLLQSNCGVSVLDFTPKTEGGSPLICLNRLNQTPSSPIAGGASAGRKTSKRMILVCHGTAEATSPNSRDSQMNMLGTIQSQKTAELLLDLKVSTVVSSPVNASSETANAISRVQEAADCLGADCVPRYVEMKQIDDLDAASVFWIFLMELLEENKNGNLGNCREVHLHYYERNMEKSFSSGENLTVIATTGNFYNPLQFHSNLFLSSSSKVDLLTISVPSDVKWLQEETSVISCRRIFF